MTSREDLNNFFKSQNIKLIIAADAETRVTESKNGEVVLKIPAGGVAVALDPLAQASGALYIGRAKEEEEKLLSSNKVTVEGQNGDYTLKRIFASKEEMDQYYYGFSNQTLWPLCHVTFERPEFNDNWYEGFKAVNKKFAKAVNEEAKGKNFIWVNDYQLCLVPKFLDDSKEKTIAMFWHIPWPTWEVFRILPQKKEILESMLKCDFLAFHRGYHVRNFLDTIARELEARIDEETGQVYYDNHITTVKNLPMGLDTDTIKSLVPDQAKERSIIKIIKKIIKPPAEKRESLNLPDCVKSIFEKNRVILGVDRLDYTKGIRVRLMAVDKFFEKNPQYMGKVVYLGIMAPSREIIPSYIRLRKEIKEIADAINLKYKRKDWQPINLLYKVFDRKDVIRLYQNSDVCLVTPLDDGMNLVSKEFVIASAFSSDPGMLILSQFAGSAIDLTSALIVNPYNLEEVANSIKKGLEMRKEEKISRIKRMEETLEEKNVYAWGQEFIQGAIRAIK